MRPLHKAGLIIFLPLLRGGYRWGRQGAGANSKISSPLMGRGQGEGWFLKILYN